MLNLLIPPLTHCLPQMAGAAPTITSTPASIQPHHKPAIKLLLATTESNCNITKCIKTSQCLTLPPHSEEDVKEDGEGDGGRWRWSIMRVLRLPAKATLLLSLCVRCVFSVSALLFSGSSSVSVHFLAYCKNKKNLSLSFYW